MHPQNKPVTHMKKLLLIIPLLLTLVACSNNSPELPGVFSVGKNKQIQFSPGLLQYRASTDTWRFSNSQLDFIGKGNEKIAPNYNGWIDLFGYGCSGYDNKYPWQISNNREDYAPTGDDGITGTEYDWGIHCQIQNGGPKGSWRLPTCDDWYYMFLRRENANNLATLAYVDAIEGLLLLPDGWENTLNLDLHFAKNGVEKGEDGLAEKNHLTKAQWKQLEKTGAVFLPDPGYRHHKKNAATQESISVYSLSTNAFYWCSTSLYAGASPWVLRILPNISCCSEAEYWVGKGYPVRLVKDVK